MISKTFALVALATVAGCGGSGAGSKPVPTAPGAPLHIAATPGNSSALVTWDAPPDGGSPVTVYRLVSWDPNAAPTVEVLGTSALVTGLTTGREYTFTVVAVNGVGAGPASAHSPPMKPGSTAAQTGVFTDSRTEGLRYVSGSLEGFTTPDGRFVYEDGNDAVFYVGSIEVGRATGAGVITPLSLASRRAGHSVGASDATAAGIAQFLQTLDADRDPANGISVPAAAQAAAAGQSLDFSSELAVTTTLATLTQNAVVPRDIASARVAQVARAIYVGRYDGTYTGSTSGQATLAIDAAGTITGTISFHDPARPGTTDYLPLSGMLDPDGVMTFTGSGTVAGMTVVGTLDAITGVGSGTWSGTYHAPNGAAYPVSGQFSGVRNPDTYHGHYHGTLGGTDFGSWDVTFAGSSVTGTVDSFRFGPHIPVTGRVDAGGNFDAFGTVQGGGTFSWSATVFYDGRVFGTWNAGVNGGSFEGARAP